MKIKILYLGALLFCLTACKKEVAKSEKQLKTDTIKTEMSDAAPMDSIAIQKAWQDYMTPGAMHQQMAKDSGTWNEEMTFWMGADDTKPQKSTAVVQTKMILNGLYQEAIHTGNIMGMAFEGRNTLAYDNATQQYVSTWIDNMSSGIMIMKGNYDPASKTVKMEGEITDPLTKKTKKVREVMTVVDENTQTMEMYDTAPNGEEYKSMAIIMTRKK
jgi:hypothetical protein